MNIPIVGYRNTIVFALFLHFLLNSKRHYRSGECGLQSQTFWIQILIFFFYIMTTATYLDLVTKMGINIELEIIVQF